MATQTVPPPARHLLSVHDFHRMGEAGILAGDDRIELIDGGLIDMAPIGSTHAGMVIRLSQRLTRALAGRALVSSRNPVRLDERSEPQPDIAVLRNRRDFYQESHPGPSDVLLVIEIADSSLDYDRGVKVPLYARHGVPEVWLVDLNARHVSIYRRPDGGAYREALRPGATETVAPVLLPDLSLSLADFWS